MNTFQYKNKAVSVKYFSEVTDIPVVEIIKYFFLRGVELNLNSWLNEKYCEELCSEFGLKFIKDEKEKYIHLYSEEILSSSSDKEGEKWTKKYPLLAVMGHVNHGKTSLLDRIRKSNVAAKEYGNITQHLSSYQIEFKSELITFLDTPGHEIFQKLRALGGVIADIIILVVSVEDGVQTQTKEAIQYYKKHNLKLIVFVNKIDRGESGLESLKKALTEEGVELEEYGGEVMLIKGSAKTGIGVEELLDSILLIAEIENYSTPLNPPAIGVVMESKIEKGLGPIAEVITIRGSLSTGEYLAGERLFCKVKTILGEGKKKLDLLIPSVPATIAGFDTLPLPGTRFFSFKDKEQALAHHKAQTEELNHNFSEDYSLENKNTSQSFSFIVKSRVLGSAEAIKAHLNKLGYPVLSISSGDLTESDLKLASINKAIIINFEQRISKKLESQLEFLNLEYWPLLSVYELEEKIAEHKEKHRIIEKVEKILGRCKVIRLWTHSKIGTIAGCKVVQGEIKLENKIKLIREGNLLTRTTIKSFKIETFEVKSAVEGNECGLVLNNWNNIELDDVIESYEIIERKI